MKESALLQRARRELKSEREAIKIESLKMIIVQIEQTESVLADLKTQLNEVAAR